MTKRGITEHGVREMLANPFYCLRRVSPVFAVDKEPIVTEENFIEAAVKLIGEIGPEAYMRLLLRHLKDFGT